MQTPEDVQALLRLSAAGWGIKQIARELGCGKNTVKRYVRRGGASRVSAWTRARRPTGAWRFAYRSGLCAGPHDGEFVDDEARRRKNELAVAS